MFETAFSSKDEEIIYWKNKAESFQNELLNTQEEYHLYEVSSKELEHELELQLNEFEDRNKNLIITNEKLNVECENIKHKFKETTVGYNKQLSDLQDELSRLKGEKATLQKYVRELEQANDDLERAYRATVMSLQDFEEKLNIAIEKNAILENELEEKETMVETVQRLKDEARDLRQDLEFKEVNIQNSRKSQIDEALVTSMIEEEYDEPIDYSADSTHTMTLLTPPQDTVDSGINNNNSNGTLASESSFLPQHQYYHPSSPTQHHTTHFTAAISQSPLNFHHPLSSNERITALNIVADMLRKVGSIEQKLSSAQQRGCTSMSHTNLHANTQSAVTPKSQSSLHENRQTSTVSRTSSTSSSNSSISSQSASFRTTNNPNSTTLNSTHSINTNKNKNNINGIVSTNSSVHQQLIH